MHRQSHTIDTDGSENTPDTGQWIESKASRRRSRKTTTEDFVPDRQEAIVRGKTNAGLSSYCSSPMWKNYDWARKQRVDNQTVVENVDGQDICAEPKSFGVPRSEDFFDQDKQTDARDERHWQTVTTDHNRRRADNDRYKTEFCKTYRQQGKCRYGEKCLFAHGLSELRVRNRPYKYKTERCQSWWSLDASNNPVCRCGYGERCRFIHDETPEQLKRIRESRLANQIREERREENKGECLQKERSNKRKQSRKKSDNRARARRDKSLSEDVSVDSASVVGAAEIEEDALLQDVWMTLLSSQENVRDEKTTCLDDAMVAEDCLCPILSTQDSKRHQRRLDIFGTLTSPGLEEFSSSSFLDTSYSL